MASFCVLLCYHSICQFGIDYVDFKIQSWNIFKKLLWG